MTSVVSPPGGCPQVRRGLEIDQPVGARGQASRRRDLRQAAAGAGTVRCERCGGYGCVSSRRWSNLRSLSSVKTSIAVAVFSLATPRSDSVRHAVRTSSKVQLRHAVAEASQTDPQHCPARRQIARDASLPRPCRDAGKTTSLEKSQDSFALGIGTGLPNLSVQVDPDLAGRCLFQIEHERAAVGVAAAAGVPVAVRHRADPGVVLRQAQQRGVDGLLFRGDQARPGPRRRRRRTPAAAASRCR